MRTCPVCETTFAIPTHAPARGKIYCSDKCLSAASYKRLIIARKKKCKGCDSTTVRWDATYCSRQCAAIHIHAMRCVIVHAPRDQVRPVIVKPSRVLWARQEKPVVFVSCSCFECGEWFVLKVRGQESSPLWCSAACSRRNHSRTGKVKRKRLIATTRTGFVYRSLVLKRDNYICKLCDLPLDMEADKESNYAPSIDHVVPLAKGGTHTMDNVQSAHRICNSYKNDTLLVA